jgi:drug/metabolite transporter (DMT)-like permease
LGRSNTNLLAIVSCLLWSSAFAGVKIGLEYTPPLQFAGFRFFIAGLMVFPLAYRISPGYFRIIRRHWKLILLFAFLQTFLQYVMFYTGIVMIPGAVAAIVIGSQPFFIAIVAHFLMPGDTLTIRKLGIILIGILGVVLVSLGRDPSSLTGQIAIAGVLLMVGINILSGFNNVIIASEKNKIPPLLISSASMTLGGLALFLLSVPLEGLDLSPKPPVYFLSLGWLSILSAVAISIWLSLLKRPGVIVSDLNLWKFLIPLFGAVLSWVLLAGEEPQVLSITGMSIITVALVVLNRMNRRMNGTQGSRAPL